MTTEIAVSRDGPVQILRMVRPEKKNALTGAMYGALCDALEAGDAADAVAVHVITGSNGVFTAGNDIADFLETARGTGGLHKNVVRFIRSLPVLKKPLIAAVDGSAIGIGTTMLFHCDLVYAVPDATFATPFLDLGVVPEAASSLLIPRRLGYARAFAMLALGDPLSADDAFAAGFVNAIVPAADIEAVSLNAAKRLANKPPAALAIARRLMRGDPDEILARMDEEIAAFRAQLRSPEALKAFTAFFEKRPPNFRKSV
jgi:enoyl-CoA hydratase/carnithine racemase